MKTAIFAATVIATVSAIPTMTFAAPPDGAPSAFLTFGSLLSGQPASLGPSQTGQPNQTCGSATAPNTPGQAAAAPGSAFNPSGTAGSVYAGQQPQNSQNNASVSQYDVACFEQPSF